MPECADKVESHLSCDDYSYNARNLEVSDSGDGVHSGSEDKKYGGGSTDTLGK